MADTPLNPWVIDSRTLPEDRPCSACDRQLPRAAYRTIKPRGRFGQPRRASRCRDCESKASVESRRRRREAERAGD